MTHQSKLEDLLIEVCSEFPSITVDQQTDYIYSDGEKTYGGKEFNGPLKPKDNQLLSEGQIIDLNLRTKGQVTELEKLESLIKNIDKKRYVIRINATSSPLEMTYYSEEDIDL